MYNQQPIIIIKQSTFQIQEQLGQGAFGIVLKCQNQQTKQIVAIKIQEEMNENEKEMLTKMRGKEFKNLIKIFELEQIDNKYYVVMEYCTESLYDRIKSQGTIKPDEIRFIMKEIGNGLKEIHDLGYAHRDMKPENVLIFQKKDMTGKIQELYKICDFGTIKNVGVLETQAIGTAYYLAPEQLRKTSQSGAYTQKVDIWAFGAMIYELMTNVPLFNGFSENEVYQKILSTTQQEIDRTISNNLKLERKYKTLLLNMLQIETNKRYDIYQVQSDLRGQSQNVSRGQVVNSGKSQIIQGQQNSNLISKKPPLFNLPIPNRFPIPQKPEAQASMILPEPTQLKQQQQQELNNYNPIQNKPPNQINYVNKILQNNSSMTQKNDQFQPKFQDNQSQSIGRSVQLHSVPIKANIDFQLNKNSSLAQDQNTQKQQVPPPQQFIPQNTPQQVPKARFSSSFSNPIVQKNPEKQSNSFINQSQQLQVDGPKQNIISFRNSSAQPQTQPMFQPNSLGKLNQQNYYQNFAPKQPGIFSQKFP